MSLPRHKNMCVIGVVLVQHMFLESWVNLYDAVSDIPGRHRQMQSPFTWVLEMGTRFLCLTSKHFIP